MSNMTDTQPIRRRKKTNFNSERPFELGSRAAKWLAIIIGNVLIILASPLLNSFDIGIGKFTYSEMFLYGGEGFITGDVMAWVLSIITSMISFTVMALLVFRGWKWDAQTIVGLIFVGLIQIGDTIVDYGGIVFWVTGTFEPIAMNLYQKATVWIGTLVCFSGETISAVSVNFLSKVKFWK